MSGCLSSDSFCLLNFTLSAICSSKDGSDYESSGV